MSAIPFVLIWGGAPFVGIVLGLTIAWRRKARRRG